MNRRGFLGLLGAAVAAPAALVEALEPKRTIFLPPRGGWFDFSTERMTFKSTERFSHGWTDQRAFYGRGNPLLTREQMNAELLKGLNEVFEREYAKHEAVFVDIMAERLTDPNAWYLRTTIEKPVKYFRRATRRVFEAVDLAPVVRNA